ncbi:trypsin-like serine protease [Vibrio sp. RC27]
MNIIKNVAVSVIIVCSLGQYAHAVQNGTSLSSDDYEDFYVKLSSDAGNCGGTLVGGYYIVTADHCVSSDSTDITVYTGIEATESYTRNVDIYSNNDSSSASDMLTISQDIWDTDVTATYSTLYASGGLDYRFDSFTADNGMNKDLVVLVLDTPIEHRTGRLIKPLYDVDSNTSNVPTYTDLDFWGWGYDENDELPDTLQEMTFHNTRTWITPYSALEYDATYETFNYTACVDATDTSCTWSGSDAHWLAGVDDAMSAEGDSGSPVMYDGAIYAVLNGTSDSHLAQFQHFTLSMDLFTSTINALVYPYGAGVEVTEGDSDEHTIEVPIQNFTTSSQTLDLSLTDATGYFSSDFSDCPSVLDSEEGCTVQVTFNSSNEEIYDDQVEELQVTSSVSFDVGAYIATESSTDEVIYNDTNDDDSSSSSGGSSSWFVLLALGAIRFFRRK